MTHEDGHAHGSGRSINGFHLLDALTAVHEPVEPSDSPLFTRFGGHAHAVGFSMPSAHVTLLRERMRLYSALRLTQEITSPPLECDAELPFAELTQNFYSWLTRCEPFGIGNREPVFLTRGLVLSAPVRFIKEKHICLQLQRPGETQRISALGWSRGIDWSLRCAEMSLNTGSMIDVVYKLKDKANPQFPGLELELVDLRLAEVSASRALTTLPSKLSGPFEQ